jgi:hypothetical protein
MDEAGGLFRVMDIRDAVGAMADGEPVDPRLVPVVRAAVTGRCRTSDRGERQVVSISADAGCSTSAPRS